MSARYIGHQTALSCQYTEDKQHRQCDKASCNVNKLQTKRAILSAIVDADCFKNQASFFFLHSRDRIPHCAYIFSIQSVFLSSLYKDRQHVCIDKRSFLIKDFLPSIFEAKPLKQIVLSTVPRQQQNSWNHKMNELLVILIPRLKIGVVHLFISDYGLFSVQ